MKFRVQKKQIAPLLDEALRRQGWTPTDGDDWNFFWGDDTVDSTAADASPRFANHFRDVVHLDHKGSLARLLTAARRRAAAAAQEMNWDFFPESFEIPSARETFLSRARAVPGRIWIAKPAEGTHGEGQFLFTDPHHAPTTGDWVVQHYLDEPFLLDGRKATLRLYVLVTSLLPLVAHIYTEGIVKRSTIPYGTAPRDLTNRAIHLTNSGVQRGTAAGEPPAMNLADYRRHFTAAGGDFERLWTAIQHAATRTLLAARDPLLRTNLSGDDAELCRFDLLGLDFLVDRHHRPWLLEVNTNPSLRVETPPTLAGHAEETALKLALLENTLRLVGPTAGDARSKPPAFVCGFQRLFPCEAATTWTTDWYPQEADRALFAQLDFPPPRPPTLRLPEGATLTAEGLIAFAAGSTRLVAFNETATAIALLSDEGQNREQIAAALAGRLSGPLSPGQLLDAIDQVRRTLWLLTVPEYLLQPPATPVLASRSFSGEVIRCYGLGPARFRVAFDRDTWAKQIDASLAAHAIPDVGPMHAIAVRPQGVGISITTEIENVAVPAESSLAGSLHSVLLRVMSRESSTAVSFHAAAFAHAGAGLVLCSAPGKEKTALCAALVAAGFAYVSDELAILDHAFRLCPAPVPLALSAETVSRLKPFLTECDTLPSSLQGDGTSVRFFAPTRSATEPVPVAALIFLHPSPGRPAKLSPLGAVAALTRSGASGFSLPRPLDLENGRALVHWLQHTPCFELTFDDPQDASRLLLDHCKAIQEKPRKPANGRSTD